MPPTIAIKQGDPTTATADALVLPVYAGEGAPAGLDERLDGQLSPTLEAMKFTGKKGELMVSATFGRLPARWLVLAGVGERAAAGARGAEALRRAYGAAVKRARDEGARTVAAALPSGGPLGGGAGEVQTIVEGISLALYRFTRYKTGDPPAKAVEAVELWAADGEAPEEAVRRGQAVAAGVALARDLVNTISDDKTPPEFAERAREIAREAGLHCTVLGWQELEADGYNAILTVGKGSAAEPRLIELTYEPEGGGTRTVALVGKTITFDSGGLDIKPADSMYSMKTDMGGGATVLGAMQAIAALKPNVRVLGILAAAENMPSGSAMRPSDVVTALNGKTFEIGNTDAEGRMVLADAVTHAARAGADEIVDLATLTGAKLVALGDTAVAAIGNDQGLIDRVLAAAEAAGERIWQLPAWEEYKEQLRSDIADLKSTGGRYAGAITAGLFIGEFVEGKPWVHLDIAGSAATDREGPYTPKGGTGTMVRTLLRFVEDTGR